MKTVEDDGLHDDDDVSQEVRSEVNTLRLLTAGALTAVHQAPVSTARLC